MKVAPLLRALSNTEFEATLVHTGQHYSPEMSDAFFRDLRIPPPAFHLGAGGGSHAQQTAEVMSRFEPVLEKVRPEWTLVVGDVNSTLACALVAKKLHCQLAHIEAGLRSFDRRMPEEINRIAVDAISDLHFTTEQSANDNLAREGADPGRVHMVGNLMIDSLLECRDRSRQSAILEHLNCEAKSYAVLTLHRPENVDCSAALRELWCALELVADHLPLMFPVHPRTAKALLAAGLKHPRVRFLEPLGYLDFMRLVDGAAAVLTDSGGLQEETTILGVPCLTLRDNTERPITITHGTNRLAGTAADRIAAAWRSLRRDPPRPLSAPPGWDGHAAEGAVRVLASCAPGDAGSRFRGQ